MGGRATGAGVSPLLLRAPRRWRADRLWSALVAGALLLLVASTAAVPMVTEAAQNAAVVRVLETVPEGSSAAVAPVVRITGGGPPLPGSPTRRLLEEAPGLAEPELFGASFGAEVSSDARRWRSEVSVPGQAPVEARLVAVDDPAAELVAVGGQGETPRGVWVDEVTATTLGVVADDQVTVSLTIPGEQAPTRTRLPVAGVYEVRTGNRPVDRDGSSFWDRRGAALPLSTDLIGRRPPVLITSASTLASAAIPLDEVVLWSVEASLADDGTTLREVRGAADVVQGLGRDLPPQVGSAGLLPEYEVVSGLPAIADRAEGIALASVERTRAAAWSGIALAGLATLLVAVAGEARRRRERELETGLGLHPAGVGGLRVVELLPVAVVAVGLGTGLAWVGVRVAGPDGAVSGQGVRAALLDGAIAAAGALLLVGVIGATWAWVTARSARDPGRSSVSRRLPWRTVLLVATAAGVLGLPGRTETGGADVVVPILVAASAGAVAVSVLKPVLRRRVARSRRRTPAHGGLPVGRAVDALVLRRLAAAPVGHDLVVVLVAAGLGTVGFVAVADRGVQEAVRDKSAVLAGAETAVRLDGPVGPRLDPEAVALPRLPDGYDSDALRQDPDSVQVFHNLPDLPPARDLRTAPGSTVVWSDAVRVDSQRPVRLLVLDPGTADGALAWGPSDGALAPARVALETLRAAAEDHVSDPPPPVVPPRDEALGVPAPVPVVIAGDPLGTRVGEVSRLRSEIRKQLAVRPVAHVPAFPGQGTEQTLVIADSETYLPLLQLNDPRYEAPEGEPELARLDLQGTYLSRDDPAAVAETLAAADVPLLQLQGLAEEGVRPAFVATALVREYQLALAVALVLIGVVGLAVQADRAADRSLTAAVVLRRTPLGGRGIRRALVLEQAALVGVATAAALVSVLLLVPIMGQLLDPDPALLPGLLVRPESVLTGTVAVLVTGLVPLAVAAGTTRLRLRQVKEEVLLRDDR
ncbi:hypothetical protein [Jannaschia sp. R86511]|uniref:hypothetical protein n=1 Tax=Jannaschia sp. R86511 TaxID=3093853 RepID=UPI0036D288CF